MFKGHSTLYRVTVTSLCHIPERKVYHNGVDVTSQQHQASVGDFITTLYPLTLCLCSSVTSKRSTCLCVFFGFVVFIFLALFCLLLALSLLL
ncbi:hypothetical protein AOLI_G00009880 [Acnodon oligacanthus]